MGEKLTLTYDVLDLFCGCGGFSHGFMGAGYKIKYGIDNDKNVKETFEYNHPNAEFILADLYDFNPNDFDYDVDIVIGSPPCQQFSTAKSNANPEIGMELVGIFREWIDVIKPKKWIMENVPGIFKYLSFMRYPEINVLNSVYYGVPQIRKRCFAGDYCPPLHTHRDYGKLRFHPNKYDGTWLLKHCVTVWDALKDIMTTSNKTTYTNLLDPEEYSIHEPCKTIRSIPIKWIDGKLDLVNGYPRTTGYRKFTVRETARIQSFPDDFKFFGAESNQYKMIGNAMPPLMAFALAKSIFNKREEMGDMMLK